MGVELSPEEEAEGVGSSLRTRREEEAIIKVNRERRRNVPKDCGKRGGETVNGQTKLVWGTGNRELGLKKIRKMNRERRKQNGGSISVK